MDVTERGDLGERLAGAGSLILSGLAIGLSGVLLSLLGNPRNSGLCVSCFLENVAGALGLHGDARMMYLRPEVSGILLGAFLVALLRGDFRPRGGSSPLVRFFIGFFIMVGCAVFIGCPIKMGLRLSAGDLTATAGLVGLALGVGLGVAYLRGGFNLGRAEPGPRVGGLLLPLLAVVMIGTLLARPSFIGLSLSGPGSLHAAWFYALGAGLVIGGLSQRSRFCVTGSLRNYAISRDPVTLLGLLAMLAMAAAAAVATKQFQFGLRGQPGVHLSHLWNMLGLLLAGFGSVLAGGCPFRQLVLSGEGDLDAGVTIMGMLVGGGAVVSWGIRASSAGPTLAGKVAAVVGLAFLFLVANAFRKRD